MDISLYAHKDAQLVHALLFREWTRMYDIEEGERAKLCSERCTYEATTYEKCPRELSGIMVRIDLDVS